MSMSLQNSTIDVDESAWPSSYYGKSQRVDLEKFFEKVQQEHLEQQKLEEDQDRQKRLQRNQERRRLRRQVTFDPDPPTVCVYEPEYDITSTDTVSLDQQSHSSKDIWPSYARRPPHRLDLRPIKNEHYGQPMYNPSLQHSPTTPPLSPCSPSLPEVDFDSSDDDDERPSPTTMNTSSINPWTTTTSTPPFSPATLTKKLMTAVFTRRKRSQ